MLSMIDYSTGRPEPAGDQHPLHLRGAFTDLQELCVAIEACDRILLHESVAAEYLGSNPCCADGRLCRVELGDRGGAIELPCADTMITHRRRRVHQLMSGRSHHIKIGNLERNALLAANRSSERGALQRILRRQLQAGSNASQCQGSDGDPPVSPRSTGIR